MCICERVLWIFPHCHQVTSLAAAVRAPYLCALPSASYFSAIGHTLATQLLLISVTVIHWIMAHMTLQAYILLVVCLLYKELYHTALGLGWELSENLFRVSLWVRVPLETLYERKHPDDKGLSLYWYAIKTRAVAGYQWMQESCHLYKITWMTLVYQQDVYRL